MLKKLVFNRILRIHIFVWMIYTLYQATLIVYYNNYPSFIKFLITLIFYRIGDTILFYTNSLWILPKYLNTKKVPILLLAFLSCLSFYLGFRYFLDSYLLVLLNLQERFSLNVSISLGVSQGSIFMIFSLGYYFSQRVIQQQKELTKKDLELAEEKAKTAILEKEKSQAELAFLRSQINPHFMFNTLNMIYSKVRKSSKEAGEIVIEFANMMRYATSTKLQENEVDVRGELDFVKEYINIHKLRFNNTVYIDYDEEGYMLSHRIVPMVLITLVENAIKHGSIDDPNYPLIIRASLIDDYFTFMVHNLKNLKPNGLDQKGNTGIGIINIEKRLAAVYQNGGYSLEKEETKEDYIVTFTVNFKETKDD